jgi:hypothetical protein
LFGAGGDEGFDEGDGHGDAPESVEVEHEEGPPRADVEGGNPGVGEEMPVEMEIVGIEKRLGSEGFFDDRVGGAEKKDAGPAAPSAANDFPDEEGSAAIQGSHDDEGSQHFEGQVAEEVFGNERRGQDEGDGGADAALGAAHCGDDGNRGGARRHGDLLVNCGCKYRINQEGYALQYHLSRFGDDGCQRCSRDRCQTKSRYRKW